MLLNLMSSYHVALAGRIARHRLPDAVGWRWTAIHGRAHSVWRGRSTARAPHPPVRPVRGVSRRVTSSPGEAVHGWWPAELIHSRRCQRVCSRAGIHGSAVDGAVTVGCQAHQRVIQDVVHGGWGVAGIADLAGAVASKTRSESAAS
jgi:hypothetical protein